MTQEKVVSGRTELTPTKDKTSAQCICIWNKWPICHKYLSSSTCEIIAKVKVVLLCNRQYLSSYFNAVVRQVIAS